MQSNEVRQLFLDFFEQKDHEIPPSSSVLPQNDPTLLFTNAGMVQFKSVFLGDETRPYKRAATSQKCIRAGGKHNDLENVGRTARHHTFFEMLGNFSFGDYFKKEATEWAWEFLTEWAKLPADKLQVTVYEEDDEAEEIWKKHVGVSSERIFRLGEEDNFWQMGDTGPCGPCSEILIDQGPELSCGKPECRVGCDCDRYLEIWNLVFMQYNRDASGKLNPLPKPSIDTGMGLERLTAVLQGKVNNFDTDLFIPIIQQVENISGKKYGSDSSLNISMRVIADHMRASAFVLSEGLAPANEGRGYVLRRIIRRAARHGFMLGIEEPFLFNLLDSVYEIMGKTYPELLESSEMNKKVLKLEEERFAHTLSSGMMILDKVISDIKSSGENTIPGSELFKLYDTYGFPVDLAKDIAEDNRLSIDEQGFNEEMQLQKNRARASWVGGEEEVSGVYRDLLQKSGPTEFLGYEALQSDSKVIALIRDGQPIDEAKEGEQIEVVLNKTPFYGECGGQVGDSGTIKTDGKTIDVQDTKNFHGLTLHISTVKRGSLKTGTDVSISVSDDRRKDIKRNHTATHLLHAALKAILGDHIKQAGSLVADDRLRFDFTHFFPVHERELSEIEDIVNKNIIANMPVNVTESSLDDAIAQGVVALFGEKYGKEVRIVKAGDFSAELCGGTHCDATGEIGPFIILSEGSVASGIRRIEAITGFHAVDLHRMREVELRKASDLLKVTELNVSEKIEKIIQNSKQQEKEIETIRQKSAVSNIDTILDQVVTIDGIKVLSHKADGLDIKSLRNLADSLKNKMGPGVIVLGSITNRQAFYVSSVSKDLVSSFHAGELLKAVTGGKGGGRPDMAQGGTKDTSGLDKAISSVSDIIKNEVRGKK
jgi:alanyl-tRNA synthetase